MAHSCSRVRDGTRLRSCEAAYMVAMVETSVASVEGAREA
jgi:hypothetical protein